MEKLENGNGNLDESIKEYTKAMELASNCSKKLDEATASVNKILKENYEFRRTYQKGVSAVSPVMVLYCRKNRLGHNRLGLTVSAKLAGAVQRNRVKRLFREAYRLHEDEFATGVDLVLVARARAVGATYQEIEKSLLRALRENPSAAARS